MTTEWGDGHDDQREHVIEDISYAKDFIWCRCGSLISDIRDGTSWRKHGGEVMEVYAGLSDAPPATAEHIAAVKRLIEEREVL